MRKDYGYIKIASAISKGDMEQVRWMMDFFGTRKKSDIMRVAIHVTYNHLRSLNRKAEEVTNG